LSSQSAEHRSVSISILGIVTHKFLFFKKSISQCNGEISHIVIGENQVALPEITNETLMWQILGTYLAS
jgi:hypothetical protein